MFNATRSARHRQLLALVIVVILLTACGGHGNDRATQGAPAGNTAVSPAAGTSTAATTPAPTPTAAAPGKTWNVKMLGDASGYRYDPAALTIKVGDAVRWTVVSGPPHNVTFWTDSIPTGASTPLQADMSQTLGPLTGPLLNAANQTYTITFLKVPPGTYSYYCTPHLALGMKGKLTIQP